MIKNKSPDYRVLLPAGPHQESWFDISKEYRKKLKAGNPWRLAWLDKRITCHPYPGTCKSLLKIYPEAIEIGGPAGTVERKIASIFGVAVGTLGFSMGLSAVWMIKFIIIKIIFGCVGVLFLMCAIYFFRAGFCISSDFPVLFNRKTRKVTLCKSGALKYWKFWRSAETTELITVDWDTIQARTYKTLQMNGEIPRDTYNLALLWGEEDNPRQFKNFAYIGYLGWWEDAMLWRLWEHIRRYMEEDGPPIQPGETLRTSGTGKLPKFPDDIIAAAGGHPMSREEVEALSRRLWDEEQARNEAQP